MTPSPWITTAEAVKYLRMEDLGHPVEALQRRCRKGQLKFAKRGATYLFRQEWLDAFLTGRES